jgi:hypothetical protein
VSSAHDIVTEASRPIDEADQVMKELAEIQAKKDRLLDLYMSGLDPDLNKTRYRKKLDPLLAKEQTVRALLARVEVKRTKTDLASLLPVFRAVNDLFGDPSVVPEDLNDVLSEVINMVIVAPRTSAKRTLEAYRSRVTVVPPWEADAWTDWFAIRRKKAFA